MHIHDITLIGWLHSLACAIALLAGATNLAATKGTPQHKRVGRVYFWSMLALNLSAFAIYRFDIAHFVPFSAGPHVFGFFHWLAVGALAFVVVGRFAASRQSAAFWAYLHPIMMVLSYYLLVGGAINEAFARIDPLRDVARRSAAGLAQPGNAPIVGLAQTAAVAATFVLIVYFMARVAIYRRTLRTAD